MTHNSTYIITKLTLLFMLSVICLFEIRSPCLEVSVTRKEHKYLNLLHKQVLFVSSKQKTFNSASQLKKLLELVVTLCHNDF